MEKDYRLVILVNHQAREACEGPILGGWKENFRARLNPTDTLSVEEAVAKDSQVKANPDIVASGGSSS